MKTLTVLYDADCPFCRRAKGWLARQQQLVPLYFVAAGSTGARERFPDLDHGLTLQQITVVGDGGEVFRGDRAWAVCLWALRAWRPFAGKRRFVHMAAEWAERLRAMAKDEDCVDRCG